MLALIIRASNLALSACPRGAPIEQAGQASPIADAAVQLAALARASP